MKVGGDWIGQAGGQALCRLLAEAGHQALFVGGCVRNALLQAPVADVDIATAARPETVSALARAAGFKVIPTGIDHGTVTVIAEGRPYEITTFRRDVKTDGRRAVVAFADRIEDDAARRDFTMNALYARADGTVIDPLGGLPDLLSRRLRFVGDPEARIREDYLRILRFFRFHAWYGDPDQGLDPEGLAACAALSDGIETLSRERIGAEMRKLLAAPDPGPAVAAMAAAGILARILPGAVASALPVLVHLEAGLAPDPVRRLAVLGGEGADERLRLSNAAARDLAALRASLGSDDSPAALGWRLGAARGGDAVLARAALLATPPGPGWQDEVARGAAAQFPVAAADLMPALQGPALGARLKALEALWLQTGLSLGKDALLRDSGA
jgi:poly(A) polymerase